MNYLSVDEIKKIELDILKNVHLFCEENDIIYILTGGTLLGAIRHKGFIPWDDDIDIAMPRKDYDKFISTYSDERYLAKSIDNSKDYIFTFCKVVDTKTVLEENKNNASNLGINIDIFPLDGLPNGRRKAILYAKISLLYKDLISIKQMKFRKGRSAKKNLVLLLGKIILAPISYESLNKWNINYSKRFDYSHSDYVANLSWGFGEDEILSRKGLLNRQLVPFEDTEFFISKNYEEFLVNRYGDYMQFPPEEQRKSHHGFKAYYRDQADYK